MAPFSPARGNKSGFRFSGGRLGTWVTDQHGMSFWPLVESNGARRLAKLVIERWGGGRVLLLPNGFVAKPLQHDIEVGRRALIGRFHGVIRLENGQGGVFDLSHPGVPPGHLWPGPATTGLECASQQDGSLVCSWYHPTDYGKENQRATLRGRDAQLAAAFSRSRPHDSAGRVRITAHGHVTTNRQGPGTVWESVYVGHLDPTSWNGWDEWIKEDGV